MLYDRGRPHSRVADCHIGCRGTDHGSSGCSVSGFQFDADHRRNGAHWRSLDAVPLNVSWGFSVTRWLAVLMLIVLARVFEQGTRMREELEATV